MVQDNMAILQMHSIGARLWAIPHLRDIVLPSPTYLLQRTLALGTTLHQNPIHILAQYGTTVQIKTFKSMKDNVKNKLKKLLGETDVEVSVKTKDEIVESINRKIIVEGDGRQLLTD